MQGFIKSAIRDIKVKSSSLGFCKGVHVSVIGRNIIIEETDFWISFASL
jgi:hypothetical protein